MQKGVTYESQSLGPMFIVQKDSGRCSRRETVASLVCKGCGAHTDARAEPIPIKIVSGIVDGRSLRRVWRNHSGPSANPGEQRL